MCRASQAEASSEANHMKSTGRALPSHGALVGADVDKNAVALVAEMLCDPHVLS